MDRRRHLQLNNTSSQGDDEGQCTLVCPSNRTEFLQSVDPGNFTGDDVIHIKLLSLYPVDSAIMDFEASKNGAVKIESILGVSNSGIFEDVVNEALSQVGLYDGFIVPPGYAGAVVEYDGWADLTSYVQESDEHATAWSDILLGYRQYVAQYQDKIILFPIDGDLLHLFYRKDVLEHFGLSVPRTWDEYTQVAAATHGKVFLNQTLTGSCVARMVNCSNPWWTTLLLSSMTQTEGPWSGHMFDTRDMTPLTGPAMVQAIEWLEQQVIYGAAEEFGGIYHCLKVNILVMNEGRCVLTYDWGDSFRNYLVGNSTLRGRFGVAPTPGSTRVLDRDTMTLVDCDAERCKYGNYYEDIGYVNRAPYMAYGGFACAVNNYTNPIQKRLTTEFCAFLSSKNESIKAIIPNATIGGIFQDPFRMSDLDLELYVSQGYDRDAASQYIDNIRHSLASPNVVTDDRFPTASDIFFVMDTVIEDHLNKTRLGLILEKDQMASRVEITNYLTSEWQRLIQEHDSKGTTKVTVLEAYQKLLNVYTADYNLNQISRVRYFGLALVGVVLLASSLFAVWTLICRKSHVVRASQPFFLVMLCVGTAILGGAMVPMGIDDSVADEHTVSAACMSIPWLLALGWTTIFAALFAKLWRVNMVYRNSLRFKRLKVSVVDVLLPFAILLTWNISWLLVWTLTTPLHWERIKISDTSSYGTCTVNQDTNMWIVCVTMVAAANGFALILANIEAFRARHISVEFGESKYIAMAMSSILQIMLVGLPLLFLVDENPSASYFVRSSIIFVVCMSILVLIFIPKIWAHRTRQNRRVTFDAAGPTSGLSFQVLDTSASDLFGHAQEMQLNSVRQKITELGRVLNERGIEANEVFALVGLLEYSRMDSLVISSLPSAHRDDQQYTDEDKRSSRTTRDSQLEVVREGENEPNNDESKKAEDLESIKVHVSEVEITEEAMNATVRDSVEFNKYMVDNHSEDQNQDDTERKETVESKSRLGMGDVSFKGTDSSTNHIEEARTENSEV